MRCMKARRASDDHQIHWTMIKKRLKVVICATTILAAKSFDFVFIRSINGRDVSFRNCADSPGMRIADVAATNETNVYFHKMPSSRTTAATRGDHRGREYIMCAFLRSRV